MNENIPSDLDWVTERAACSVARVFEALKADVQRDVETRKKMFPLSQNPAPTLSFDITARTFTVMLDGLDVARGLDVHKIIKFLLTPNGISVQNEDLKLVFEATVTLSDDGKCRVKIDNQERELWQMRKRALEDLFFNSY